MIRFVNDYQLKIIITIDATYTAAEKKSLREAVAIYKESPKTVGFKSIVNAFVSSAKLSVRYISEQNIIKIRRLVKSAPSRTVVQQLRRQGLLDGTYFKESGGGNTGYIVYYDIEKYIKRIIQLEVIGFASAGRLQKDGKIDHIYQKINTVIKDRQEIKEFEKQRKKNTK